MARVAADDADERVPELPAWDPLVRLTHWGIAAAVLLNGLVVEDSSLLHVWLGYAAHALLALRLLWGVLGPTEARFSSFPPSFSAAVRYLADLLAGKQPRHRSHNPLGALMIYALWGTLAVVLLTGVMLESDPFPDHGHRHEIAASLDASEGEDSEGWLGEIVEGLHEVAANFLLFLAALHVGAVLLQSWLGGGSLIRRMTIASKSDKGGG